jgi:CDP-diacylglycerol--glycerol-3-phosphate 3-phosphatidyltransferase
MYATYSRIVMAPVLLFLPMLPIPHVSFWGAILFILGSLTDWLDGYWARKYSVESAMGKFMDPIADKILVMAALLVFLSEDLVNSTMVFLLLSRDIFIGGIRSVAATNNIIIAAKPFGKWKTGFQMVGIPMIFFKSLFGLPLAEWGAWLLWVSVVLSIASGFEYTWGYYTARQNSK